MAMRLPSKGDRAYRRILRKLTRLRQEAGLSHGDLAQRLGWPASVVRKIETCDRIMDPVEFHQICKALGQDDTAVFQDLSIELEPRSPSEADVR